MKKILLICTIFLGLISSIFVPCFAYENFSLTEEDAVISDQITNRDYSKRLEIFKEKFKEYYEDFSTYKNILVTGDRHFCDTFYDIFKDTKKNFSFAFNISDIRKNVKYDLIIDSKYNPQKYDLIFNKSKNISNFTEVYRDILYKEALEHLKSNKVDFLCFDSPKWWELKNLMNIENNYISERDLHKNDYILNTVYGDNSLCQEFIRSNTLDESNRVISNGWNFRSADYESKYCHQSGGIRLTTDAPETYQNKIHLFGQCTMRGRYVPDKYTIPSFLQRYINKDFKNRYLSVNYGVETQSEINDFEYILNTYYNPGDKVVLLRDLTDKLKTVLKEKNIPYFETSSLFSRPHNNGYWKVNDVSHINHNGNRAIAKRFYEILKNILTTTPPDNNKVVFYEKLNNIKNSFIKENPEFLNFLNDLKSLSQDYKNKNKKIGSLNVNCNPFTLGHKYLIEEALKNVDHLFLFVVEEDASDFSFKDRYEMVKHGIADLENITLLKTGKWMCSKFTFPEYFSKDNLQKVTLNPTKDIELYGKYIAPALGATIRFAGEEPFDLITRQHNNFMREKLPIYGINFFEIPRKTLENGQVISASTVRKLLRKEDWEELAKFVPKTTFEYLKEHGKSLLQKEEA